MELPQTHCYATVTHVTMEMPQTHCYATGTVTLLWKRHQGPNMSQYFDLWKLAGMEVQVSGKLQLSQNVLCYSYCVSVRDIVSFIAVCFVAVVLVVGYRGSYILSGSDPNQLI
jgi:hypothetical protein